MARLEFFFDCSSPWTYLGFHNIQPLAAEFGIDIAWKPILVGGLFNTINPSVYHSREYPVPAKHRYMRKDLTDWARYSGIVINHPPSIFPINSVKAMRGCIALKDPAAMLPFATRIFEAYWAEDRDIADESVLRDICSQCAIDPDWFVDAIATPEIKDQLKSNTQELADRGGYGSPTIFLDSHDMYFGNDRLPLIRRVFELE